MTSEELYSELRALNDVASKLLPDLLWNPPLYGLLGRIREVSDEQARRESMTQSRPLTPPSQECRPAGRATGPAGDRLRPPSDRRRVSTRT